MIWNNAKDVRVAGVQAQKVVAGTGTGTVTVWTAWPGMGMTKTASDQRVDRSKWTLLTGWAARSGYPETVIESDGIRVPGGTFTVTAYIKWASIWPSSDFGLTVAVDGSRIGGLEVTRTGGDPEMSVSGTVSIIPGLVQVFAYSSDSSSTYRRVESAWLTIQ